MKSACVSICTHKQNPDEDVCWGCGRSREEMSNWKSASPEERSSLFWSLVETSRERLSEEQYAAWRERYTKKLQGKEYR